MFDLLRSSFSYMQALFKGCVSEQQAFDKAKAAYIWCLLLCEIRGVHVVFKQENLLF